MIGTLALLASWTAGAARASHCVDRQRGCSGHGECVRGGVSCKCDPLFHGDRCDVWRSAPSADLTELQNVDWINCTHGRSTNGTGVDQHCDFENKSVCEAAGAPTVPQTCANEDMFLICDYTGCYSKPFCEGFLPPGYTPPGRNPQPYHCFCPNGGTDQNTMSRPTTIPGVPGVMCAPPCEEGGQACCGSFQRDHRFHTPLPILAKPQVCADQNDRRTAVSASSILRLSRQARNSDANADSFVCVVARWYSVFSLGAAMSARCASSPATPRSRKRTAVALVLGHRPSTPPALRTASATRSASQCRCDLSFLNSMRMICFRVPAVHQPLHFVRD
jgi:hypothetical protein